MKNSIQKFDLHEWEVSPTEEEAYKSLKPGDCVKVLYLNSDTPESNWCEIISCHPDMKFFITKPEPCLFVDVPKTLIVNWHNIKDYC